MFIKMKRNLFKYFGKKKDQQQEENKIEVVHAASNAIVFEESVEKVSENIKLKEEDPKEKLKKKLQLIARNTKSARIRKKNLKRLVNLFGDYKAVP